MKAKGKNEGRLRRLFCKTTLCRRFRLRNVPFRIELLPFAFCLLPFAFCLLPFALLFFPSCGYHIAGHTTLLPKTVHSIAILPFGNVTTRYRISDLLSAAITREFISRTRYQIVTDQGQADAILAGAVVNFFTTPTILDASTGRATSVQALVILQVSLRERATGAILYNQPNLEFRERYAISIDPKAYFDESTVAMDRLSRDVARSVVSAILEKF